MVDRAKMKSWLIAYLRQPFVMIVWFMETFKKNRMRLKAFSERQKVSSIFKTLIVTTFFVWLLIFAFLSTEDGGDRFTCAVKSLYSGFDSSECRDQPWTQKP
jgi:bacteriorhodopsin